MTLLEPFPTHTILSVWNPPLVFRIRAYLLLVVLRLLILKSSLYTYAFTEDPTSLVVQWLESTFQCRDVSSSPDWGTVILHGSGKA